MSACSREKLGYKISADRQVGEVGKVAVVGRRLYPVIGYGLRRCLATGQFQPARFVGLDVHRPPGDDDLEGGARDRDLSPAAARRKAEGERRRSAFASDRTYD